MFKPRKGPCIHGNARSRCVECRRARQADWRSRHEGRGTTAKKAWRATNPERHGEQATKQARSRYQYKYGITYAEACAMRAAQDNRCLGCQVVMGDGPGSARWNVDHFVDTAGRIVVRGILCFDCNVGIGKLNHDPVALRRLADYLDQRGYVLRTTVVGTDRAAAEQPQLKLRLVSGEQS